MKLKVFIFCLGYVLNTDIRKTREIHLIFFRKIYVAHVVSAS